MLPAGLSCPAPCYAVVPRITWLLAPAHAAYAVTRRSAVGFVVWLLPFMAWMLLFMIGGASVLGETAFRWLDITQIELAKYGLA